MYFTLNSDMCTERYRVPKCYPLKCYFLESFFQILVLVNGEVDFTLSSICLYYKYNQVDVIFQIKYTTVLQKFFLIYGGWKGLWTFF